MQYLKEKLARIYRADRFHLSRGASLRASQSNPGRTLRAARSVDALHAAFTR
ncbi:hypothetical protein AIG70_003600 [Salmonella enterica subsp. enterica]|nr:hypothetical protein [Salmonella enterica subsp. enterica serovar Abaetetuba]EDT6727035.1 hypothetical protein [Salmonella enterica subsp. enterica serovar Abaetetuba]EDV5461486.1 hypothetical protein [Salmonella enterica subsp. enterica serovar Abaetetuba]